jgi:hypothetical protein
MTATSALPLLQGRVGPRVICFVGRLLRPAPDEARDREMDADQLRSRRSIIGAGLGGAAALAATALAHPAGALAATGDPLLQGQENTANAATGIVRDPGPDNAVAFYGKSAGGVGLLGESATGEGVIGRSGSGAGVQGYSDGDAGLVGFGPLGVYAGGGVRGVVGVSNGEAGTLGISQVDTTGVYGFSGDTQVVPDPPIKTGVFGLAVQDSSSRGVLGRSTSGQGVRGEATSGIAGAFSSATGHALSTSGRLRFGKASGIATIASGASTKTVTPGIDLAAATFVLLTPRRSLGGRDLWYTVDPTANTFTIRASPRVTAATSIGWLVLS